MDPWKLLTVEERLCTLYNNASKLHKNRADNLIRLEEQKKNCHAEIKAFRHDLDSYLDNIERCYVLEISTLASEQKCTIQSVFDELESFLEILNVLQNKMKEVKSLVAKDDSSLLLQEAVLSEKESFFHQTITNETGCMEIDLNMLISPELQLLSSKNKSLGEVFITRSPVDIEFDQKREIEDLTDVEMVCENDKDNEKIEEDEESTEELINFKLTEEQISSSEKKKNYFCPKFDKAVGTSDNIKENMRWGIDVFNTWRQFRNEHIPKKDCERKHRYVPSVYSNISYEDLNFWLQKFVTEVRRKDGSEYPSEGLRLICNSVWEYFQWTCEEMNFDPSEDERFSDYHQTLSDRLKKLEKQNPSISIESESTLWESLFKDYRSNSQNLSYAVYYYNCEKFGLKTAQEHYSLDSTQYSSALDHLGYYLQFTSRIKGKQCIKHYMHAENPKCLVQLFLYYLSIIPSKGPFYRQPLEGTSNRQPKFSRVRLRINELQDYTKTLCEFSVNADKNKKTARFPVPRIISCQSIQKQQDHAADKNQQKTITVVKQEPEVTESVSPSIPVSHPFAMNFSNCTTDTHMTTSEPLTVLTTRSKLCMTSEVYLITCNKSIPTSFIPSFASKTMDMSETPETSMENIPEDENVGVTRPGQEQKQKIKPGQNKTYETDEEMFVALRNNERRIKSAAINQIVKQFNRLNSLQTIDLSLIFVLEDKTQERQLTKYSGRGKFLTRLKSLTPVLTKEELSRSVAYKEDFLPRVKASTEVVMVTPSKLSCGPGVSKNLANKQKEMLSTTQVVARDQEDSFSIEVESPTKKKRKTTSTKRKLKNASEEDISEEDNSNDDSGANMVMEEHITNAPRSPSPPPVTQGQNKGNPKKGGKRKMDKVKTGQAGKEDELPKRKAPSTSLSEVQNVDGTQPPLEKQENAMEVEMEIKQEPKETETVASHVTTNLQPVAMQSLVGNVTAHPIISQPVTMQSLVGNVIAHPNISQPVAMQSLVGNVNAHPIISQPVTMQSLVGSVTTPPVIQQSNTQPLASFGFAFVNNVPTLLHVPQSTAVRQPTITVIKQPTQSVSQIRNCLVKKHVPVASRRSSKMVFVKNPHQVQQVLAASQSPNKMVFVKDPNQMQQVTAALQSSNKMVFVNNPNLIPQTAAPLPSSRTIPVASSKHTAVGLHSMIIKPIQQASNYSKTSGNPQPLVCNTQTNMNSTGNYKVYPVSLRKVGQSSNEECTPFSEQGPLKQAIPEISPDSADSDNDEQEPLCNDLLSESNNTSDDDVETNQSKPKRFEKVTEQNLKEIQEFDTTMTESEKHSTKQNTKWGVKMFQEPVEKKPRFKDPPSKAKIEQLLQARNERNTTKQTAWGVKLFREWLTENGNSSQFEELDNSTLNDRLCYFYGSLQTKRGTDYSKSALIGIRAAISRHLSNPPFDRMINIKTDGVFMTSNRVLRGLIKTLGRQGKDVVLHKKAVTERDIEKLYSTGTLGITSPVSLQNKVFWDIMFHFRRRGLDNLHDLTKSSFVKLKDKEGKEYYIYSQDVNSLKNKSDSRMYAKPGDVNCPVESMDSYLSKLSVDCQSLFQHPLLYFKKNVIWNTTLQTRFSIRDCWYAPQPLGKNKLASMMSNISKQAGLSVRYTNHCITL